MTDIKVPELGEDIDHAEVLRVLVAEGDRVEPEQPLLELETDKAALEMPSPQAGIVGEILVSPGDTVTPGQTAMKFQDEAETSGKAPEDDEAAAKAEEKEPEAAAKAEAEEKEPEAEAKAEEKEPEAEAKAEEKEPEAEAKKPLREEAGAEQRRGRRDGRTVPASPATRRLAREVGVDLAEVAVRAEGDRVTPDDIKRFLRTDGAGRAAASRRERMSRLRRTGAERLAAAWKEVPLVTHHDRADITEIEAARKALRNRPEAPPLTMTALAVKAAVPALRAHPLLNSSLDLEANELVYHGSCHVGIAVDTEHGLLVPVVRNADRKTTRELSEQIAELAERARRRKLDREEMQGATFSVTNLGGIGGLAFTPIVVPPQVAILGLSRARSELVLADGAPSERLILPLSLSYDHRVVDGAEAARFTRLLARLLESPLELLLEC